MQLLLPLKELALIIFLRRNGGARRHAMLMSAGPHSGSRTADCAGRVLSEVRQIGKEHASCRRAWQSGTWWRACRSCVAQCLRRAASSTCVGPNWRTRQRVPMWDRLLSGTLAMMTTMLDRSGTTQNLMRRAPMPCQAGALSNKLQCGGTGCSQQLGCNKYRA